MTAKWDEAKIAKIGFLIGQGFSAKGVALNLADGTTADAIARKRRSWGLTDETDHCKFVDLRIPLDNARRADLSEQSSNLGISPAEFVRRVLICVLDDDLYSAVNDGRFK